MGEGFRFRIGPIGWVWRGEVDKLGLVFWDATDAIRTTTPHRRLYFYGLTWGQVGLGLLRSVKLDEKLRSGAVTGARSSGDEEHQHGPAPRS